MTTDTQTVTCPDCNLVYDTSPAAKERARLSGRELEMIVRLCPKHASVDALIAALNGLGWHSQNGVDICWCHAKSDVDHTKQCRTARAAFKLAGIPCERRRGLD